MEILFGQRMGNWIVLDEAPKRKGSKDRCYNSSCTFCGITYPRTTFQLRKFQKGCKSCWHKKVDNIDPEKRFWNAYLRNYKGHATRRNLRWELTEKEAVEISTSNCHYCNQSPKPSKLYSSGIKNKTLHDPEYYKKVEVSVTGIDRKDSKCGYTIENCVPCCSVCNRAKMDMPYEDFINLVKRIYINLEPPQ